MSDPGEEATAPPARLGPALRRAWVGYRRRLDQEMAAAGFDDSRLPDGRVLRMCSRSIPVTISEIGRELGITRQGASKIVASLRDRGYVTLGASATDAREKTVLLSPRASDYLTAHRDAARRLERQLRDRVGAEAYRDLFRVLAELGGADEPRLSDYLRRARDFDGVW